MSDAFLGQISIVGFNFPPKGWAFCNGQLLAISQNTALFSLLGTFYGGNGTSNFALPNLQGRAPVHVGTGQDTISQGEVGGETAHTLSITEIPTHDHVAMASYDQATTADPTGNLLSSKARRGANVYAAPPGTSEIPINAVAPTGGGQPHDNMQPYLALSFVIALTGIFPSRP